MSTTDIVAAKPGLFTEMLLMQFKANIIKYPIYHEAKQHQTYQRLYLKVETFLIRSFPA